jgi:hypothetical protein
MKKLVIAASLFFACGVQAQQSAYQATKPVMCDSLENVTKTMKEKYGEDAAWFGDDIENNSKYVMLTNFNTKTWTFVQFTRDWACVLGVGTGSSQMTVGKPV